MGTDYKTMYLELNCLLEDICEFLSTEKLRNLSAKDKRLAETLINRSKKQLQEIAKVQTNDVYVPMDKKATQEEHGECDGEVYSSVDDYMPKLEEPYIEEVVALSYLDFPAKDASQGIKYGYISMKRKFLLGFDVMKRIYATIRKEWLLIYWGEKDSKPMMTFNLHDFQAKESEGDRNYFELFSNEKKVYHFMALTHKDMLQWVVSINKCHDDLIIKTKHRHIIESENQYSNDVDNNDQEDIFEQDEEIYSELPDVPESPKKTMTVFSNMYVVKPPLPHGRPGNNKPKLPKKVPPPTVKPITPTNNSSDEDLGSYDEIFTHKTNTDAIPMPKRPSDDDEGSYHDMSGNMKIDKSLSNSTKSLDTFSVESGDSIYQVFSVVKSEGEQFSHLTAIKAGGTTVENQLPPPPPEPPSPREKKCPTEDKGLLSTLKEKIKQPSGLLEKNSPKKDEVLSPPTKPKLKLKPSIKKIPPPPPKRSFRKD